MPTDRPRPDKTAKRSSSQRAIFAIFFCAGLPALVYQVTWQRALGLYFGVDVYSATITVATFMGGLGFGALAGGTLANRVSRPLALYAAIELGLALLGASSPFVISSVGGAIAGATLPVVALTSVAVMALPTFLMGATLPVMSRIVVESNAAIGERLSALYGIDTLGAGFGALLTSYLLIGWLGLDGACFAAAAVNAALAASVLLLVRRRAAPATADTGADESTGAPAPPPKLVLFLAFGSGLVALGYEIVWYRLLGVILHGTVYVFGTILAVYLLGIAAGSLWSRKRVDRPVPLGRFAIAQILMSAYVLAFAMILGFGSRLPGLRHVLSASFFTSFHPSPMLTSQPKSVLNLYSLFDIPMWTFAMLGVPTFLMGFGFPHLMRAASVAASGVSAAVGRIYAANIVGSILGTLLVGFVGLGHFGSERTLQILVIVGTLIGAAAAWVSREHGKNHRNAIAGAVLAVVALVAAPGSGRLVRATHLADFDGVSFVSHEDTSGVVALRRQDRIIAFGEESKVLNLSKLYIDGAAHGRGDEAEGEEWTVAMAMAVEPQPRRVLSIGLGDGFMCAAALQHPGLDELVIVELNEGLLEVLKETRRGAEIASSPRVRYVNDDGRRWLNANPGEKFDLIMTFPLHAAHAGYGNLFSMEFYELVSRHLSPGGLIYTRSVDQFATAHTIANSFTDVVRVEGTAYMAKNSPFRFDPARLPFPVADLPKRVDADRATILEHAAGAPLSRDLRPQSEYYLTYPWARFLLAAEPAYRDAQPRRFAELSAP